MALFRVRYSCPTCGVDDAPVDVEAREAGVDVGDWLKVVVGYAVAVDHRGRSPACGEARVKVVVPGAPGLVAP